MPMSWCGRIASTTRSVGTAPLVPRSGARKIGTSATGAGILDEVADAHDIAGHGDVGAQRRHRILRDGAIGEQAGERQRQSEKSDDGTDHRQTLLSASVARWFAASRRLR